MSEIVTNSGQNGSQRVSSAVHQARAALSTVSMSGESDKLEAALHQLTKLAQVRECFDVLVKYGSGGAAKLIADIVQQWQNSTSVLVAACETLRSFVYNCHELRAQLESLDAHKSVLAAAVRHPADAFVQEAAMSCLAAMAEMSDPESSSLRAKLRSNKTLPLLMSTLSTYNHDVRVQQHICRVLAACLAGAATAAVEMAGVGDKDEEMDSECSSALDWLLRSGEYRRVASSLTSHVGKRDVQLHACRALLRMSAHPQLRPQLIMDGVHEHVIRTIKDIPAQQYQITACALLARLALIDDWEAHRRIIASGVLTTMVKVAGKHADCAEIQHYACVLLERLGKAAIHSGCDVDGWLSLLRQMMSEHRLSVLVQASACCALARLLSVDPGVQDEIGDLGEEIMIERKTSTNAERDLLCTRKRSGDVVEQRVHHLHHLVVMALNLHGSQARDASVAEQACRCLYWMCEENARMRRLLLQKGAHSTVVTCLKQQQHGTVVADRSPGLYEWGLRVLHELARGSERCYNDVYNSSAHVVALQALALFPHHEAITLEAIGLLTCLSLVKISIIGAGGISVRSSQVGQVAALKFCDDGFLAAVMKALCQHESHMPVVEVAFEAIGVVLDLLPTQRSELTELSAVDVILQCMSCYVEELGIQTKGCMLLRYLAAKEQFRDIDGEDMEAMDSGVVAGLPTELWANQAMIDLPVMVETSSGMSPAIKRFLAQLDKTSTPVKLAAPLSSSAATPLPPPSASASKPTASKSPSVTSTDSTGYASVSSLPDRSNAERCIEAACLITVALKNFLDDDTLVCEACCVIKELSEHGDKIRSCFVEQAVHRHLFKVLRRDQVTKTVLDHVCSAVHALCSSSLKNRMLLQGVEDRDLVVVRFLLQNGADANCIDTFYNITPLSWAARNGDDEMVRVLLYHDISDYRSPLREALEIGAHSIIAKILGAIVGDQRLPGVASLSGYDLNDLCSAWLVRVLAPSGSLPTSRRQSVLMDRNELTAQRWLIGCQAASRRASYSDAASSPTLKRRFVKHAPASAPSSTATAALCIEEENGVDEGKLHSLSSPVSCVGLEEAPSCVCMTEMKHAGRVTLGGAGSPSIYTLEQLHLEQSEVRPLHRRLIVAPPPPLDGDDLQSPLAQVAPRVARANSRTLSGATSLPYASCSSPPLSEAASTEYVLAVAPLSPPSSLLRSRHKTSTFVSSPNTIRQSIVRSAEDAAAAATPSRPASQLAAAMFASESDIQSATAKAMRSPRLPLPRTPRLQPPAVENITELDISDNGIETLTGLLDPPSLFESLSHIVFINASHNRLASFPVELAQVCSSLRHLQVSYNAMATFPLAFFQLQQLERLSISHNQIVSLDEFTAVLSQVQMARMNISDTTSSAFSFADNSALSPHHWRSGSDSSSSSTRSSISLLSAEPLHDLSELQLSENLLETLPADFSAAFPSLKQLFLNDNRLVTLSPTSLQFNRLTKLDLCGNRLTELSSFLFDGCPCLEWLKADNNEISSLPSDECAELQESLGHLSLAHNKLACPPLQYLPSFLLQLPRLRYLDVSSNGLTGLPSPSLWQSKGLRSLVAANNAISVLHLGENAGACWGVIDRLDLHDNNLIAIPSNIGDLDTLSSFNVDGNEKIQILPSSFGKLHKLWEFPRHKLPNLELDAALKNARMRDIVAYMEDRLHNSAPYYRIRMLVVGRAGQGKTSLVRLITGNLAVGAEVAAAVGQVAARAKGAAVGGNAGRMRRVASQDGQHPVATVGVSVHDWKCYRRVKGKQLPYTISCWDFAGQEEYYSTHQCFLSSRSLYLAVYNMTDEQAIEKLRPWLLNIHARAPGCPVLAIGTHLDTLDAARSKGVIARLRESLDRLRGKPGMPKIVGHEFVDASKKNHTIAAIRSSIFKAIESARTASGQPILGGQVPAVYLALEDRIVQEAKRLRQENSAYPIIQERRMRQLAHDITGKEYGAEKLTKEKMAQAVCFLHEAGVLLHYDDAQSNLSDLYFLDPEWLCSMMAKIVTHKEVNGFLRDGVMERSQVDHLFVEERKRLPPKFIPQYLRLLERFEIVLSHEKDGKPHLLIPSLLPTKRQVPSSPGFGSRRIIRHYQMPYIPLGFMARLIARLYLFADTMLETTPTKMMWRSGVHMRWGNAAYCIVEVAGDERNKYSGDTVGWQETDGFNFDGTANTVVIEVTCNASGRQLLGYLADHFDTLVEEWYEGLRECDVQGNPLISSFAVCPECSEVPVDPLSGEVMDSYRFPLDDLVSQSEGCATAECPFHSLRVPIRDLAPDIMLGDLPDHLILDPDRLQFDVGAAHRLGKGGFGDVYRWTYDGRPVAIKVFKSRGGDDSSSPNRSLRQEVQVMRHLCHPSVIDLIGVQLQPRFLVMELAPQGSLRSMLERQEPLFRPVQHRIAHQVVEGLEFLHKKRILYRDLKSDNVLIFSTNATARINAKISDYGISRFACPAGLAATTGTPGYRPPEMIRARGKMAYDFSADIYSFGLFLFELATNGRRPFEELDFPVELDNRYLEEAPIPQLTECDCKPWPDMQDAIAQCLQLRPDQRPSATQLVQRFSSAESLCLRQAIPVSMGLSVQALAVRNYRDSRGNERCQVWIGSGSTAGQGSQLSIYDLSERPAPPSGMALSDRLVLCMITVTLNNKPLLVLVGCLSGNLWCYDAEKGRQQRPSCVVRMQDAVVSLLHYDDCREVNVIVAGLANGSLAVLEHSQLLGCSLVAAAAQVDAPSADLRVVELGTEPVMDLCMYKHQLWCACGTKVFVLDVAKRTVVHSWAVPERKCKISNLAISSDLVWTSVKGSAIVRVWSAVEPIGRERGEINCLDFIREREQPEDQKQVPDDWHVVSLLLEGSSLWVGMSSGHILVIDVAKRQAQAVVRRHDGAVRCIALVKLRSGDKTLSYVLSGGMGYLPRPGMTQALFRRENASFQSSDSTYGHLLVWEASLGKMQIRMNNDQVKRHCLTPARKALLDGRSSGGAKQPVCRSSSTFAMRSPPASSATPQPSTPRPSSQRSARVSVGSTLTPSWLAMDSESSADIDMSFEAHDTSGSSLFS